MTTAERPSGYSPDILIPKKEIYPPSELVVAYSLRALHAAAGNAADNIFYLVGSSPTVEDLEKEEKFRREQIIDNNATEAFILALNSAPFQFIGIDSEGAKEAQEGKAGIAMDLAIGTYGNKDSLQKVCFVVDVVEGTTAATHGRPNAWSIMAVAPEDGITPIPVENGKKLNYFQKLFAPREIADLVSIEKPTAENLGRICRVAQIAPNDITVVVMNYNTRPGNQTIAENVEKFGAQLKLISAGDFAWCINAIQSDPEKPVIVMGRGGAEEGSIAAVAARAIGANCQLRYISHEDKNTDLEGIGHGHIWDAKDYVPADPEDCTVFGTAITRNEIFPLKAVRRKGISHEIDSLEINSKGFNYRPDEVAA